MKIVTILFSFFALLEIHLIAIHAAAESGLDLTIALGKDRLRPFVLGQYLGNEAPDAVAAGDNDDQGLL